MRPPLTDGPVGIGGLSTIILGVDSPFFSTIVLFKNQLFLKGFWWFSRKIQIPGKNGHGS